MYATFFLFAIDKEQSECYNFTKVEVRCAISTPDGKGTAFRCPGKRDITPKEALTGACLGVCNKRCTTVANAECYLNRFPFFAEQIVSVVMMLSALSSAAFFRPVEKTSNRRNE